MIKNFASKISVHFVYIVKIYNYPLETYYLAQILENPINHQTILKMKIYALQNPSKT